jgi:hypothetical protein
VAAEIGGKYEKVRLRRLRYLEYSHLRIQTYGDDTDVFVICFSLIDRCSFEAVRDLSDMSGESGSAFPNRRRWTETAGLGAFMLQDRVEILGGIPHHKVRDVSVCILIAFFK